eukprot:tig00021037_g17484.t1
MSAFAVSFLAPSTRAAPRELLARPQLTRPAAPAAVRSSFAGKQIQFTAKPTRSWAPAPTSMAYTIVTDVCEGDSTCMEACPVNCIHEGPGQNAKGKEWFWIDFDSCIDCGICLEVCPIEGAILPEQVPEKQKTPEF